MKLWKKILCGFLAVIVLIAAVVTWLLIDSQNYEIPDQKEEITNNTGLIQAHGRSLYDANGDQILLRGVNAGNVLLQEGWMSVFALDPERDEDGNLVKDKDGNLQYPEFSEAEFRSGLASNPNLKGHDIQELMEYYWSCMFTEEDFRIIKEDLEMNTVRLPFFYLNILNEDLSQKSEAEAFEYLDWFVEQAGKQGLYVVLDLHGAPGSQSGYEHSGTLVKEAGLWHSEANIAATVDLWDFVSDHYSKTRPDLGKWVATYDIMNEPTYEHGGTTTEECWQVFDRIYDAIRENGDAHVITMEGCWDFSALPDPADYGWENVQYEYHWYNWQNNIIPYEAFFAYYDATNQGRDYDVPVFIGEFTAFEDRDAWADMLGLFEERQYSWTVWSYKAAVTGWWTTSWGVYTIQMNLDTATEATKCNVATCTYEEFIAACESTRTEHCATATLYEVLKNWTTTNPEN